MQVLSEAVHLDGCRLRHALGDFRDHDTGLCCVVYGHFFLSFQHGYTKLNCKQGRQMSPTVLLYERREVALVFYALGDVNRTNGLCLGHTFLNSGYIIIRVGLTTANLEEKLDLSSNKLVLLFI